MTRASRTISLSIDCPADQAYEFIFNPENIPRWAAGLCKSVSKSGPDWIVDTHQGRMTIRFAERNMLGVLDHYVSPASGAEIHVPMRVLPNGPGSELLFTLFRQLGMSDQEYEEDIRMVERDLNTLKSLLDR